MNDSNENSQQSTPGSQKRSRRRRGKKATIQVVDGLGSEFRVLYPATIDQCVPPPDDVKFRWIHVFGVHDISSVMQIGRNFSLHPLTVEDIFSTEGRSKIEIIDGGVYVVLRALHLTDDEDLVESEEVSFVLLKRCIITFQESDKPIFEPVVSRFSVLSSIRVVGVDFLFCMLLDVLVDSYFPVLEFIGDQIEILEDEVVDRADREILERVYSIKRALLEVRRAVWPARGMTLKLDLDETDQFSEASRPYVRDVYDHILQILDRVDTYRESIAAMFEIYLSSTSNKLNEIMKKLTVISTTFMPLTLIASIYGMNFENQMGLDWPYGYVTTLSVMLAIGVAMLLYFRRLRWI